MADSTLSDQLGARLTEGFLVELGQDLHAGMAELARRTGTSAATVADAAMAIVLARLGVDPAVDTSGDPAFLDLLSRVAAEDGVRARVAFAVDRFDAAMTRWFTGQLTQVLTSVVAEPAIRIGALDLSSTAQPSLIDALEAQAARTPDRTAVVAGQERVTYAELHERAGQLARLLANRGVGAESLVAVALPRTADAVVAMVAVLKSGGAFLPIDPGLPAERQAFLLGDAKPVCVLTDEPDFPADVSVLALADPAVRAELASASPLTAAGLPAERLAYVLYTSGSTGTPKGVAVPQTAIAELVRWAGEYFGPDQLSSVLLSTSFSFDVSMFELFAPLAAGGQVELAANLPAVAERHGWSGTVLSGVPSVIEQVLATGVRIEADHVVLAGEGLPARVFNQVRQAIPGATISNIYGPTEATVYCLAWRSAGDELLDRPAVAGTPLPNAQAYVLDAWLRPVRHGLTGELYIAGGGLARGYRDQPGLTAERFIANPFDGTGARMYRTGDLARWTADGDIEVLGRADDQVKVRGVRIEPAEIEGALTGHGGARRVVVVAREDQPGDKRLVAYVVPADGGSCDTAALRARASAALPSALVPSAFVELAELPLTATGKLDTHALPAPVFTAGAGRAPKDATEARVCELFAGVLGLPEVGVDDDFFALGGHSLLATRLVNRLRAAFGTELTVREVFEALTPARLAELLGTATGTQRPAVTRLARPDAVPLSPAQQRLWFLNRLDRPSAALNVPFVLRLRGALDRAALEAALGDVFERHESLRTVFAERGGVPCQVVLPAAEARPALPVAHVDDLEAALREATRAPFDLTADLPLRARLFADTGEHVLHLTMNHIAFDGWSLVPLSRDLHEAYAARQSWQAPDWAPLPVQYADYTLWQQELLGSDDDPTAIANQQLAFWRDTLTGLPEELALPTDYSRPARASYRGGSVPLDIGPEAHEAILHLTRTTGTTVFMVLHAAVTALLTRLGAGTDIPVGTTMAGRTDGELEGLIGFFVNTLVLRVDTSGDPTFHELLRRAQAIDLAAYEHQDVPFEHVVETLNPNRTLARHPLFQVMLDMEQPGGYDFTLPGLMVESTEPDTGTTEFDLLFTFTERYGPDGAPTGITGRLAFATDLFAADSAGVLADRFQALLARSVTEPGRALSTVDLYLAGERAAIMAMSAGPVVTLPEATVAEQIEQHAASTPHAPAVSAPDGTISYAELNDRANRIAHLLLSQGIGPGHPVGVALPRSLDLITAFLAIMKAGATYLPIDTTYPADRVNFIVTDANPTVIITHDTFTLPGTTLSLDTNETRTRLAAAPRHNPTDADRRAPVTPDTPHYLVYTSGTTGRPKGIVLPNSVLANIVAYLGTVLPHGPGARAAQFSAVSFDVSVQEILAALAHGKTLCVPDEDTRRDPTRLAAWLDEENITEFGAPDVVVGAVYEAATEQGLKLASLRTVWQGGEALQLTEDRRVFHAARPGLLLHSGYGPAETHCVTTAALPAAVEDWPVGMAPLGRPIWNTRTYLLDEHLHPVPNGIPGEVYLAGVGLAQGYLNQPALTAARFTANPFDGNGSRMYRTGDLARRLPDGTLQFLGRTDDQIKILGIRVEPAEINALVATHPSITHAATIAHQDSTGDKRLITYIVPTPGTDLPTTEQLRHHLAGALPHQVIPTAFITLDKIPTTATGKIDRTALPAPTYTTNSHPPANPTEELLCGIYAQLLAIPTVGATDNFFHLGGHSLLVTRLVNRVRAVLDRELPVRHVFEAPTPRELARRLDDVGQARPALPARKRGAVSPMSYAQQRLWFLDQLEGASATYNLPYQYRITGSPDLDALEAAFTDLVGRHESLRTVLREVDGHPVQQVLPAGPVVLHRETCTEQELSDVLRRVTEHAFDLSAEEPLRASLVSLDAGHHVLVALFHHVAADGWSRRRLDRDLSEAYRARLAGETPQWAPLPVQYADYALWQRDLLGADGDPASLAGQQLQYWTDTLAGLPAELDHPTDRPRPPVATHEGEAFVVHLDTSLHTRLAALARDTGTTLSMLAHAALATVLTRLGAGTDIPIGIPVAGRTDEALDDLIGFFLNTLVLRVDTSGDPTFHELLTRVRHTSLAAYANQDVPFERVVEAVNPPRSSGRNPLFQIMLEVSTADGTGLDLSGVDVEDVSSFVDAAKFDLSILVHAEVTKDGGAGALRADVGFSTDLFDAATVRRLIDRLVRALAAAAADPDQRLSTIDLLGDEEQAELARYGAGPIPAVATGPLAEPSLQQGFRRQVERTPDAVAVRCAGRSLTYRQLDEQSNQLAHRLIAAGAGPERPVTTLLDRTVTLLVALTAIVKAGAYYVPLHHAAPPDRQQWIHDQSGATILLADTTTNGRVHAATVVLADDDHTAFPTTDPVVAGCREQLAYAMYTSGSTGNPKGVAVTHQDVLELVNDSIFTPGDHDRVLLLTPYEFDPSTYSFWYPLLHGGTAVIAPHTDLTVARLARVMQEERITGVDITAGLFRVMAEEYPECFAGVHVIITGGDVVSPVAVRRALEHCPGLLVRSNYGPTETTLFATSTPWRRAEDVPAPVPIGRPLDGMHAYVLDDALNLVSTGVTGELYLAGTGLARGYLHRPDLTAERFVANPFAPNGARMYRTGDRVRWTSAGLLDFVGRADNQVKIRGFRIELPEIEAVLAATQGVRQAAVITRDDPNGDRRLVAYLVTDDAFDPAALDGHLRSLLPDHMVPTAIIRLDALPLTPNNKLDIDALPAPVFTSGGVAPRNATEARMCELFAGVLGLDTVGADDGFFALGGHSLLATRLVSRIRAAFGTELSVRDVFEALTPAGLAARLADATGTGTRRLDLTRRTRPDVVPLSPTQRRLWFLNLLEGPSATYAMPLAIRLRGALDHVALQEAFGDVVERHESLRTVYPEQDGVPCQVVLPVAEARPTLLVEHVDDLETALLEASRAPFDLATDLPLRVRLFAVTDTEHILHLTMNHIAVDGQSTRPLMRDVAEAYAARMSGQAPDWAPLPVQYADYTLWQHDLLGSGQEPTPLATQQLEFWRTTLADVPDELALPTDYPRPARASYRGRTVPLEIGPEAHQAILHLTRTTGTTVFMVLHAAVTALLTRLGAGTDIPVGTPAAGRTDDALDDVVGFFLNTLVLRVDTTGDPTFQELLGRAQATDLAAYEHQDLPFEHVVEALNPDRTLARHPLFQVMLQVLVEATDEDLALPGLITDTEVLSTDTSPFDLLFTFSEQYGPDGTPAGLIGRLAFATDLFQTGTATLLSERFETLLARAVAEPALTVSTLDLFLDGEHDRELALCAGETVPQPAATMPEQIEQQAARNPEAAAVRAPDGALTYAELNERANRLAHLLLAKGIGSGHHIGVALPRGLDLIIAFLAVLKTGAAYLPVDVTYPPDRVGFIITDADPAIALTTESFAATLPGPVLALDDPAIRIRLTGCATHNPIDTDRPAPLTPETPNYIVYTSGTTGQPKGVVLPARVLTNMLAWSTSVFQPRQGSRVAQFSAVGFDVAEHEMLTALINGKTLCVPDEDTRLDPVRLASWLEQERVTEFYAPTVVISAVYEAATQQGLRLPALRHVAQGGEALHLTPQIQQFHAERPDLLLHNLYGPSETHYVTTATLPEADDWPVGVAPLGGPIWNLQVLLLDDRLRPVPAGVPGEIYLAGVGLATGYLNRPTLTSERFVANPFGCSGARMYRTGDLARRLPSGAVQFLGRTDDQVKIRGIRVEPAEITALVTTHPRVMHAVTIATETEPGDKRLVTYLVPAPGQDAPTSEELRQHLGATLPQPLIPAAFVTLDKLPINTNGKVDRKALPMPQYDSDTTDSLPPANATEELLCGMFAEVLNAATVGAGDNFFHLGGHSLLATRLISLVRTAFNRELSVRVVFEAPTPRELATQLDTAAPARTPFTAMPRPELVPMSYAQQRLWFIDQFDDRVANYNLPYVKRLAGPLDTDALQAAITDLVARHETLRTILRDVDGQPVQQVQPPAPITLHRHSCTEAELADLLRKVWGYGFDMAVEAPMRASLITVGAEDHVLVILMHHIVTDGGSTGPLARDLTEAYRARLAGAAPTWSPLPLQYADYALRQREVLGSEDDPDSSVSTQLTYWRETLAQLPVELDYPTDRPRPEHRSQRGGELVVDLGAKLHAAIVTLARGTGTTLAMVARAGLAALLTRLGAGTDIPLGTTIAGRTDADLDDLIGFFVNTLVLRINTDGDPTFRDLLARVQETSIGAYAHQDVPFERVVEAVNPPRSPGRNPLFQVTLQLQVDPGEGLELPGIEATDYTTLRDTSRFDLTFLLQAFTAADGQPGELLVDVGFSTDLFDETTIQRMIDRLARVFRAAAVDPDRRISAIDILDERERAQLARYGAGRAAAPPARVLGQAFRRQADRTPRAVAVQCANRALTYRELDERANQLAHRLIAAGAGPERPVTTLLGRGVDLVVALTAILKSGSYYVPLHHAAPLDRQQWVHDHSGAHLLLTDTTTSERPHAGTVVLADDDHSAFPTTDPVVTSDGRQLAYVLYTEGGTGDPLGVAVTHHDVLDLVADTIFTFGERDRVLLLTPYEVDPTTYSIWHPLLHGGTAVIAPRTDLTVDEIAELVEQERISRLCVPSGLLGVIAEKYPESLTGVREVVARGGVTSPDAIRRVLEHVPGIRVRSGYGPAETTLLATSTLWQYADEVPAPAPIGEPLDGMHAHVLDNRLNPVPPGVTGELYVAGTGLARGYLHHPDRTAERFVACPFEAGQRMFRTGDRVRWTPDGLLDFVGRADQQATIRGHRVDLSEVEAVVGAIAGVRQAAVIAHGDTQLVAYVVTDHDIVLEDQLRRLLPDVMVPTTVIELAALPRTQDDRLDVAALPAPDDAGNPAAGRALADPREQLLCDIFAKVLGVADVGSDDDFFELGGHSLLATHLVSLVRTTFGQELPVRAVFDAPTPRGLARQLDTADEARPPLTAKPRPALVPMSHAQQRLWFIDQLEGPNATYNLPYINRFSGPLDVEALRCAVEDVVARHESLRTSLREVDGQPVQQVMPAGRVELHQLSSTEDELFDVLRTVSWHAFDLAAEAPVRANLISLSAEDHVLAVLFHHSCCDGLSLRPFGRDLSEAYRARLAGKAPGWAPLPVQYADYTLWQREVLGTEDDPASLASQQLQYWIDTLAGLPTELGYATDRPRPTVATHRGGAFVTRLDAELHTRLLALSRTTGTTLSMVANAAMATVLTRLGAGTDIPIGTPVAGRDDTALDSIVGFFLNTLVLRIDTEGDPTFHELLTRVRETSLAAYANDDVPFERIVEAVNPPRSSGRNPLFQVMLQVGADNADGLDLTGSGAEVLAPYIEREKFDISIALETLVEQDGSLGPLQAFVRFAVDLFDEDTVRRLFDRLALVLTAMAADPGARLSTVDLLDERERQQLAEWNDTATAVEAGSVVALFEQRVALAPDTTALVFAGTKISYRQLDAQANRLAHLLAGHGVRPESVVALCLPGGSDMIAAILAVWKAGAAYLPIDPDYPAERVSFMLADSGAAVVLGAGAVLPATGEAAVIAVDDPALDACPTSAPAVVSAPDGLAYVIYTSGSTGQPKGVAVTNGALANYVRSVPGRLDLGQPRARYALLQPQATDLGNTTLFTSLATGGELHILDADAAVDPAAVAGYLAEHRIEHVKVVPSHLAGLAADGLASVLPASALVLGGEAAPLPWLRDLLDAAETCAVFNHYGPTEATIGVATARLTPESLAPIGSPIANTQLHVLDTSLNPVPVGVLGELYIAGAGLARGYVGRPGMTATRFVACPFAPGQRMYRTGDLARRRADGQLVLAGRADDQVKIRGFRVEPGELRTALLAHPDVTQAAVVAHEYGPQDTRLVAYVVPADGNVTAARLREFVAQRLPTAMVPATVVSLDRLPLTPNGKLDRAALPTPSAEGAGGGRPPANRQEELLCGMFAEVLGATDVGVDDNFFDLGGHSMLAMRLVTRIRARFECQASVRALFEAPTPATLARWLATGGIGESFAGVYPMRTTGSRQPLFCLHPGSGLAWVYSGLLRHLDPEVPLYGIQSVGLSRTARRPATLTEMARVYLERIRAVQPNGPYRLMGWSLGGVTAHEVAVQLQELGEEVTMLGILDTNAVFHEDKLGTLVPAEYLRFVKDDSEEMAEEIRQRAAGGPGAVPVLNELTSDEQHLVVNSVHYHQEIRPRHRPRVFHGDALFIRATADKNEIIPGAATWQPYIRGRIDDVYIDCSHYQLLDMAPRLAIGDAQCKDAVATLAEALTTALNKASNSTRPTTERTDHR